MNRSIPRAAVAALALSALFLAACGSDDTGAADSDPGAATNTPTAAELDGRAFESTGATGHDLVDGSTVELAFLANSLAANAGCNSMSGAFQIEDDVLTAGPFASTMMACEQPLMDQDTWLNEFLSSNPTIALDGRTMTLTGDSATLTLDEVETAPLAGITWTVTGTLKNEALTSVPADSAASITIADDGTVAVNTGCNTGSGTVEVTATSLTFGPIATTRMACEPELMDLEAAVTSVLQGEVDYTIEGTIMTLRSGTGTDMIGLDFTADS